jgi:hypothetical protein
MTAPVVLIVNIGEDDHDRDLLLGHQLPEGRHGGVQRVLRHNEPFPAVEA